MYTHICVYTYTCIHMYIYIYIYTYIHVSILHYTVHSMPQDDSKSCYSWLGPRPSEHQPRCGELA